jgi:hypothetical protein
MSATTIRTQAFAPATTVEAQLPSHLDLTVKMEAVAVKDLG